MPAPPTPRAPVYDRWGVIVHHGCNQDVLPTLPANSVDSIVTDPPAGVGFMGRSWDSDRGGRDKWIAWLAESMVEAKRVLKPGGYGLVWALPRTSHWTAMALEDAGFEVRDCVTHLFAGGSFPKSLDIGKAIDKAAGVEREVVGTDPYRAALYRKTQHGDYVSPNGWSAGGRSSDITAPATDAARQWQGWGTALAPKSEHWWLIRKPLAEGTVAANVLTWGVGGINIDATRVPHGADVDLSRQQNQHAESAGMNGIGQSGYSATHTQATYNPSGRWPSNVLLSHHEECDTSWPTSTGQSGTTERSTTAPTSGTSANSTTTGAAATARRGTTSGCHHDCAVAELDRQSAEAGGASRYFPTFGWHEKATAAERPRVNGQSHNTVKAVDLMRWLVRLVTPPGGTVLDLYAGTGTTGQAARAEGMKAVLIEEDEQSIGFIKARLDARAKTEAGAPTVDDGEPADLLDLLGGESA